MPKLLNQVIWEVRKRNYSNKTEEAYILWIKRFIIFHCKNNRLRLSFNRSFKKLYDNHGLIVSFIFYSEGDGDENNGVVIYLENKNDHNISFQFTLIFRAGANDRVRTVDGTMIPRERRTGSNDELYFIPFEDGRSLSEVGIKNCKVRRI